MPESSLPYSQSSDQPDPPRTAQAPDPRHAGTFTGKEHHKTDQEIQDHEKRTKKRCGAIYVARAYLPVGWQVFRTTIAEQPLDRMIKKVHGYVDYDSKLIWIKRQDCQAQMLHTLFHEWLEAEAVVWGDSLGLHDLPQIETICDVLAMEMVRLVARLDDGSMIKAFTDFQEVKIDESLLEHGINLEQVHEVNSDRYRRYSGPSVQECLDSLRTKDGPVLPVGWLELQIRFSKVPPSIQLDRTYLPDHERYANEDEVVRLGPSKRATMHQVLASWFDAQIYVWGETLSLRHHPRRAAICDILAYEFLRLIQFYGSQQMHEALLEGSRETESGG